MKTLIEITRPTPKGGSITKSITWHGFIGFRKGFTNKWLAVGKHYNAWHFLGFRISFWEGNSEYYHFDSKHAPAYYDKPLIKILRTC